MSNIRYNSYLPRPDFLGRVRQGTRLTRVYENVPGAFEHAEIPAGGTMTIPQGRSLVSSREVKQVFGAPGKVLAAIRLGGSSKVVWICDFRGSVPYREPKRERGELFAARSGYIASRYGRREDDLGETGIVVVDPGSRGFTKDGFLRLDPSDNPNRPSTWATVVSGSRKPTAVPSLHRSYRPASEKLDLPSSFPGEGFLVEVSGPIGNPYADPDEVRIRVHNLETRAGVTADGEQAVEVLTAPPRTVEGLKAQFAGRVAMPGITG